MSFFVPSIMKDKDFQQFSSFIYERVGLQLPPAKKTMLEARLQKRLKVLGIETFADYGQFVFSAAGQQAELVHLIDVVTTNKTDFFREHAHFEYLTTHSLSAILNQRGCGSSQPLRIWSAGYSSGEEPYTLAMVLNDYSENHHGFHFTLLASDISTRILQTAKTAIYPEERVNGMAPHNKKKYLLRSRERSRHLIRICPQLRALIEFRRINIMDADFGVADKMDVIF